jgi:hypothetical protein
MKYQARTSGEVVEAMQIVEPMMITRNVLSDTGKPGDYLVNYTTMTSFFLAADQFEHIYRPVNAVEVPLVMPGLDKLERAHTIATELRDILREIGL